MPAAFPSRFRTNLRWHVSSCVPRRYKLGINRDPAPFVFPEGFVVLLGGPDKAESPNFKKVRADGI